MSAPRITVTALGTSGSGKTTFLLGMYAVLSAGLQGYFLNAPDQDVDRDLAGAWDRLLDDGDLPPPTSGQFLDYQFDFLDGVRQLLSVDWLDYRGGALDDSRGSASGDVPVLHDRLTQSDSIYVVIDGSYLAEPVDEGTAMVIQRQAGLRRMTSLLQTAFSSNREDRTTLPSIVVLVTKADLIPSARRGDYEGLTSDVERLVPVCFAEGLSTMICPVQLGHFGLHPPERVPTGDIAPRYLHRPLLFSLAEYMRRISVLAGSAAEYAATEEQRIGRELSGLRSGAGAFLRWSAISQTDRRLSEAIEQTSELTMVQKVAAERAARLFDQLSEMPLFRDGLQVTA